MTPNSISPEALYRELGALLAEMPNLVQTFQSPETDRWLARTYALVEVSGDAAETERFRNAWDELHGKDWDRTDGARQIRAITERALARAELRAPAAARGAFVTTGATFDAFQAIGKVLGTATRDLLIVDHAVEPLTQSLKDFAARSPASVVRVDADMAALKVPAYEAMWAAATPL